MYQFAQNSHKIKRNSLINLKIKQFVKINRKLLELTKITIVIDNELNTWLLPEG